MNTKVLLLLPAALGLLAPTRADAYVGFRLNLAVPLFYPAYGYSYPQPGYVRTATYAAPLRAEGEQVTVAPGPGYVWIAGHWTNNAQRWVWLGGHWELPPSPSAAWVAGHWVKADRGWVWANDTWTVGNPEAQAPPPPAPPAEPAPLAQAPEAPGPSVAPSTPAPPAPDMADGTVVDVEPPAPIAEYVPASPYPDYVWLSGYWGWHGGWYWTAGRFAPRPHHGAVWLSGGWGRADRGWAWHGGHWR